VHGASPVAIVKPDAGARPRSFIRGRECLVLPASGHPLHPDHGADLFQRRSLPPIPPPRLRVHLGSFEDDHEEGRALSGTRALAAQHTVLHHGRAGRRLHDARTPSRVKALLIAVNDAPGPLFAEGGSSVGRTPGKGRPTRCSAGPTAEKWSTPLNTKCTKRVDVRICGIAWNA
jgi:hypothetical protein